MKTRTVDLRNATLQPIAPRDVEIKGQIWFRPVEPPGLTGRELPAVQESVAPERCLSATIERLGDCVVLYQTLQCGNTKR